MSRPDTIHPQPDEALKDAARRVILACGPVLAKMERPMIDRDRARELDEARGSLFNLAAELEKKS